MNVPTTDWNNKFSENFIENFTNLYVGYIDVSLIDDFIYSLEKNLHRFPINNETESNLYRILNSRYDKASFVFNCINYPIYSHLVIAIASSSNYLTDILIMDPEFIYWLTDSKTLQKRLEEKSFLKETKKMLMSFTTFEAKLNSLKSLKRKETLRIGVRDILGYSDIKTTIEQLSILAKSLSSILITICYDHVIRKHKITSLRKNYALIALGKLGGNELNYSSDIDLILIFNSNYKIRNKEYFEILTEALQLFIESSNTHTESGYLYRVDFRLRPDGKSSPLCRTLSDTMNYYETRGEDWERQMLIKASFISGNKKLYDKFINYLQPFIYPKIFSFSPSLQINKLKSEIENKLKNEQNIKLIKGGIRDIEFSVQALQLLNGGKIPDVRTGNTLEAIRKLKLNHLLNKDEAEVLHSAYYLYRKIEHYQQLKNDRQTHDIPKDRSKLYSMSLFLGFRNAIEFEKFLYKTRKDVRKIYNSIIIKDAPQSNLDKIEGIEFKDIKRASKNLDYLENGIGIANQRLFDTNTSHTFSVIKKNLIRQIRISPNPDKLLNNFTKLILQVKLPSIWYKELTDKKFAKSVLQVCEYSDKIIEMILDKRRLTDLILSKKVFQTLTKNELTKYNTEELLFIITFQFTIGKISQTKYSYLLSNSLKSIITKTAQDILSEKIDQKNFLIAGMGSFSINEMTLISDVDLIFITNLEAKKNIIENQFQKYFNSINDILKPFKCDCRLRPEGKSSQLVWNLDGYINYLNTRAKFWEFQSLNKINYIYGNKRIFNKLISAVNKNLDKFSKDTVKKEIKIMRNKLLPISYSKSRNSFNIKTSSGGMLDVDFIIQYLLLIGTLPYNKWRGKSEYAILDHLIKTKRNKNEYRKLKYNLSFLKKLSLITQNIFNKRTYNFPSKKEEILLIGNYLKYTDTSRLERELEEIKKFNKSIFNKTLK